MNDVCFVVENGNESETSRDSESSPLQVGSAWNRDNKAATLCA
ncbi:hypothetical protein M7I_3321 [Glarea lozoyensis 74030]|uniref:Uncharacterized protein n=1 Tax=Glarea lozoyensis (strain ATCC 74030 / MF5533) TaxID=1104152 RepID=H0EL62_GLAL7|nr:hypothetical protein M7I_3321 [Glarea lozoyensis 74030]